MKGVVQSRKSEVAIQGTAEKLHIALSILSKKKEPHLDIKL